MSGEVTTVQLSAIRPSWKPAKCAIFLCKVAAWCDEFGCHLTIPQSCEYQQLRDKQEA
jgi:hypothetical protein